MPGPQQEAPFPTGEEEQARRWSSKEEGSFYARDEFWRNLDKMYEVRDNRIEELRDALRVRNDCLQKQRKYEEQLDQASVNVHQTWVGVDGSSVEFTYDEFLEYMAHHTDNEDRDAVRRVRYTLDNYPSAISFAEKAGFAFVTEDDIDPLDATRTEKNLVDKAQKIRFLNDMIATQNAGEYVPYYDRDSVYSKLQDPTNEENVNAPFTEQFKENREFSRDDAFFEALGREYDVDAITMKQWYEQADRVLLAYERERLVNPEADLDAPLQIDADYESLFKLSGASAAMQSQVNKDGIHIDGFFEKIKDSADAFADMREAKSGLLRNASRIDRCEKDVRWWKDIINQDREQAEAMMFGDTGVASGLQSMYAGEMDRYRNGYTQQAPLMWDMAKRWSREKTRFFDGRTQAKENMRDQKWTEKTGINERGIKTDGSLSDFFKSIVRECRRELYKSGVSDFSLVGDVERLMVAIGLDKTQRAFEAARLRAAGLQDKWLDSKINKWDNDGPKKSKDTANYTRAIQIASEAKYGTRFNGSETAMKDYDGRDNNPADVMAGWDDANEWSKDKKQQERNLQNLIDDKGYNTSEDDNDGPRLLGGPEVE